MKQEHKILIGIVAVVGLALLIKRGISGVPLPAANILDTSKKWAKLTTGDVSGRPLPNRRGEEISDQPLPGGSLVDTDRPWGTNPSFHGRSKLDYAIPYARIKADYPTFTGGTIVHPEYLPPIYKLQ